MNAPFYLTFDEEAQNWWMNDERDSSWTFDCCTASYEVAKQYRDEANATAEGA